MTIALLGLLQGFTKQELAYVIMGSSLTLFALIELVLLATLLMIILALVKKGRKKKC